MDYSTQLLEFMDGTLDGADELALFNALSSNEELRAEFKHLLAISSSVRSDVVPFIPPTGSTQRIFSELGFTPPLPVAATGAGVAAAGLRGTAASGLRKYYPMVASAVLASLTTAAVFFALGGPASTSDLAGTHTSVQAPHQRAASLDRVLAYYNPNGTGTAAGGTATGTAAASQPLREVVRYVYLPQQNETTTDNTAQAVQAPPAMDGQLDTRESIFPTVPVPATHYPVSSVVSPQHERTVSRPAFSGGPWWRGSSSRFAAELRDNVSMSFPNATVDPASTSWLHNKSLGIFYVLTDNQSLGVEFGQEPFFQRFEARDDNGRRYQYEQTPILPWAGMAYRFSFSDLGPFSPFGQLLVGGTKVGYLGRSVIGVNYSPSSTLRLTAGIEGSLLYYPVQGSWYQSAKLGLTYGIGFTF